MGTAKAGRPIENGGVVKRADGTFAFRYRNLPGLLPKRPTVGGFQSRAEAFATYLAKVEEIERLRGADDKTKAEAGMKEWTLGEYVSYFVAQYDGAPSTRAK